MDESPKLPLEQLPGEDAAQDSACDSPGTGGQAQPIIDSGRRIRQAIVVIHGIGDQRPMDTLRSFVDALLADDAVHNVRSLNKPKAKKTEGAASSAGDNDKPGMIKKDDADTGAKNNNKSDEVQKDDKDKRGKYYNKPDAMNELLEMRCLQVPASHWAHQPLTDYYEYYWQHHMEGSKYTHVVSWLWWLMWRRPKMIPQALRPVYFLTWTLALIAVGWWLWGLVSAGAGNSSFIQGVWRQKLLFASGLATVLVQWVGSYFLLRYVADAARYLTPRPCNIEARNKIRSEGIKLLRTLHDSGKYKRIVIVGHSLGSVIGYDIIRNLWVDLKKPADPHFRKQPEMEGFNQEVNKIEKGDVTPANIEAIQQCQHRLWQECVDVGIPWLITDFVTLGSPLAHAQLLMADDSDDFAKKKDQYEYPCCPPCCGDDLYYGQNYRLTLDGESVIRKAYIPHNGAPFSCTRWTNLYFPYRRLVFGDLIGGPLNGVFGKGIRDIAVEPSTNKYLDRTLISHVRYWTFSDQFKAVSEDAKPSLETLRKVLRLDFLYGKNAKKNHVDAKHEKSII